MIPQETVDAILAKADIVDVISKYIQVSKKGRNYVAVCPFHDDHDPSMSISQDKQMFKCFVCGEGGNAIAFIMKFEKISYTQALIKLGDMVGIHVTDVQTNKHNSNPRYQSCIKVLDLATEYTNFALLQTKNGLLKNYLHQRDLTDEMIRRFGIGYNDDNDTLTKFLLNKNNDPKDLVAANLSVYVGNDKLKDVFANRITFPIRNVEGHTIGFTARSMDANALSKYINTAETPVFKKGELVYNIDLAQLAARKANQVILVEGVMDVIAFAKAGIDNVVSTLGTACTKYQLSLIKSLATTLIFAYDGDNAGQNAIFKAGNLAYSLGFKIQVIANNTKLDPDELYLSKGKEALQQLVAQPIGWLEFLYTYFKTRTDFNQYEEKKKFAVNMIRAVQQYGDTIDQSVYFKRLCEDTGFDLSSFMDSKKSFHSPVIEQVQPSVNVNLDNGVQSKLQRIQMMIISQLFTDLKAQAHYQQKLSFLPEISYDRLAKQYLSACGGVKLVPMQQFYEQVGDQAQKNILNRLAFDESLTSSYNPKALDDAIGQLEREIRRDLIKQKRNELQNELDPKRKSELEKEIAKLYQLIKPQKGGLS